MRQIRNGDPLTDVVTAYVSRNALRAADVPKLIAVVHDALRGLMVDGGVRSAEAKPIFKPTGAQIRKSIQATGLVSFIDGKVYQTLKRHLASHGLEPASYRKRYHLPDDYPMVSPSYSARRSHLAKAIGLGSVGRRVDRGPGKNNVVA